MLIVLYILVFNLWFVYLFNADWFAVMCWSCWFPVVCECFGCGVWVCLRLVGLYWFTHGLFVRFVGFACCFVFVVCFLWLWIAYVVIVGCLNWLWCDSGLCLG